MPDEDRLPPGPQRKLTAAIYVLYQSAGMPGTRRISDEIQCRNDLNDTVSHEAIRGILMGKHARWLKVESLVLQLATWAVVRPDPKAEAERIHGLWLAAEGAYSEKAHAVSMNIHNHSPASLPADSPLIADRVTGAARDVEGIPAQLQDLVKQPLASLRLEIGTLDIFDRQVVMQMIKEIGAFRG